jgi:hypothetical protein
MEIQRKSLIFPVRNDSPRKSNWISHLVDCSETNHPYPQWREVSSEEVAMKGETYDAVLFSLGPHWKHGFATSVPIISSPIRIRPLDGF